MLATVYPEIGWNWEQMKLPWSGDKTQRFLLLKLQQLWPNESIQWRYHHPDVKFNKPRGRNIEFDFFLPGLSLAFEYQVSS